MAPISTGQIAPPTIVITNNEDPNRASSPNPFNPDEKMVGNMIDIKNSVAIKA